jgi:membrane protease YdiL (CAAX protease family)
MSVVPAVAGQEARPARMVPLTVGFILIYLVLDRSATWTNSLFGEYGAPICALVIAMALLVERWIFGKTPMQALATLGFGTPAGRGMLAAALASIALLAYFPILALMTGAQLILRDGWLWIVCGVFLQGGIAEELLWRGYLFRHLRATRGFWRAAAIAMVYMVAQHTLLLLTMPLPIALAALVVALLSSFPLAYLFEAGGNTIWAPALLHAVIQGALKVVTVPEDMLLPVQLGWMALSMLVPYLVFLIKPVKEGSK